MSDNRTIATIHEVRSLCRKWKKLTDDQKRAVVAEIEDADVNEILKAIKRAKKRGRA